MLFTGGPPPPLPRSAAVDCKNNDIAIALQCMTDFCNYNLCIQL